MSLLFDLLQTCNIVTAYLMKGAAQNCISKLCMISYWRDVLKISALRTLLQSRLTTVVSWRMSGSKSCNIRWDQRDRRHGSAPLKTVRVTLMTSLVSTQTVTACLLMVTGCQVAWKTCVLFAWLWHWTAEGSSHFCNYTGLSTWQPSGWEKVVHFVHPCAYFWKVCAAMQKVHNFFLPHLVVR